jgi:hypothetical protein
MSLITSGLTIQVDFTNQSSLIIGGGTGVAVLKATNLVNPSLFFSGITGGLSQYDYTGFQNPTTLQFSGVNRSDVGISVGTGFTYGLTNKLGDYGSYQDYTTWFMFKNTGGTIFNTFFTSDQQGNYFKNYLGENTSYDRWFATDNYSPTGGTYNFVRTFTFYTGGTSVGPEPSSNPYLNEWVVASTRVYQVGTSAFTELWISGSMVSQTVEVATLLTATNPIFWLLSQSQGIAMTEVLMYDRKLSDSEMVDNYNYFNEKYFGILPVTPSPTPTNTNTPSVTPTNTITPTVTTTNTNTPTVTTTNTNTPTVTPTNTNTPSVTPTNTPTPSITPSVSVSSLPSAGINFKTISDDFRNLADTHKQLNSYGLGDIDQISYWTQSRDKQENTDYQSPFYPLLYVVPSSVQNDLQYKTWGFNTLVMDIVERDLDNQIDVLSDTNQILQDVISQFRLSVTNVFGNYYQKYYLDDEVTCIPFLEKYDDMTNGWNGELKIKTMTPLDRCSAAYYTFTGTPIDHNTINFKTFHDDFRLLADHHKQINSFGLGALEDLSFDQVLRDRIDNTDFQSPYFPLMYVVPQNSIQKFGYMTFEFDVIVMDIIERDLSNQVDVLSDTNQILDDIISQFRLSVTDSLGNFNEKYYLQNPVMCTPFLEKYTDLTGGWSARISIDIMDSLDRCDAAFMSFLTPTPTVTSTNTPTPSVTPTNTNTPTVTSTNTPTVTQTNTGTVTPTVTETPTNTPTQTTTNTSTPTPSVTNTMTPTTTTTLTITPTTTTTPTNTPSETRLCKSYTLSGGFGPIFNWTNCDGTPGSTTTFGGSVTICALAGSVTTNFGIITDNGICTTTPTPTPTLTQTPSGGGNKLWNTNTTNWENETGLWNTV